MKGYYLFAPVEKDNYGPDSGVERKVRSQHKALGRYVDQSSMIGFPFALLATWGRGSISRAGFRWKMARVSPAGRWRGWRRGNRRLRRGC